MRKYIEGNDQCEYYGKLKMGKDNISDPAFKTEIFKDEDIHKSAEIPFMKMSCYVHLKYLLIEHVILNVIL